MSPIKDRSAYPGNWRFVREKILKRAKMRCECNGECGLRHPGDPERCAEIHNSRARAFQGKVILTVAHLDHDAAGGDHSDDNLKAMCQRCHLRYDQEHRRYKATGQMRMNLR